MIPGVKPPGLSFAGAVAAGVGNCAGVAEGQITQNASTIPKQHERKFNSRLHVFVLRLNRATRRRVLETFALNPYVNPGIEGGRYGIRFQFTETGCLDYQERMKSFRRMNLYYRTASRGRGEQI